LKQAVRPESFAFWQLPATMKQRAMNTTSFVAANAFIVREGKALASHKRIIFETYRKQRHSYV